MTNHTNTYKSHLTNKKYEKRGCKRENNNFHKQGNSEKIRRLLLKNKTSKIQSFPNNRKSSYRLLRKRGGKKIMVKNESEKDLILYGFLSKERNFTNKWETKKTKGYDRSMETK